jgi:uncharacterized protein YjiK
MPTMRTRLSLRGVALGVALGLTVPSAVLASTAGPAGAGPAAAPAATGPGIDLSTYRLVGRYALPSHLDSPSVAPPGSELATEVSAITYNGDTDSLFVVGDEGTSVVQVSKTGALIDSMTLTGFADTEGITYVGGGKFVLSEERLRNAVQITYAGGTTLARSAAQGVKLGTTVGNIGLEGIGYDPLTSAGSGLGFVGVKESGPLGIFQTTIDFAAGTATNGSATTEPANLFDPALVGTSDLSDVYPLSQVSTIDGGTNPNLLVISQESGRIVNIGRDGTIANQLDIVDAGAPLAVPAQTMEGVALDRNQVLYTTSEGGGGDASHPQLLVWAPGASPLSRLAVTEVAPWGSDASYHADWFELTNTGSTTLDLTGVKVDDSSNAFATAAALTGVSSLAAGESAVFFEKSTTGDAAAIAAAFGQAWFGASGPPAGFKVGSYTGSGLGLSSGGDGVNLFASNGTRVTGVSFGAATANTTFDNTARLGAAAAPVAIKALAVDGIFGAFVAAEGVGLGSPGNVEPSGPVDPGGSTGAIKITEVAPWGSGSSPYAADWIEVTNTGTTSVNLTGWKMDDSSALFSSSVELVGVSTLPAGASAVFFEGTDEAAFELAFAQAWFGQNLFDAGFRFGHYTGGGVGLSTGGDGVTLFAPDGALVTGVAFGASSPAAPFATFDNAAAAGTSTAPFPVLTTLSAVGTNGAFRAVDSHGIGSPGTATVGTTPSGPKVRADFDGNGKTDVAVFRPSNGSWFVDGSPVAYLGLDGDIPVPADYTNAGRSQRAVFRPSTGAWFVDGAASATYHGLNGDVPVPGDYDGNGTTDKAVYRPSTGGWHIAGQGVTYLGLATDIPVPADYDGDGDTDLAVFRPSTGAWYVQGSAVQYFGASGDVPLPADYDGNGTADKAVFRPSEGAWHIDGQATESFGLGTDIAVPGQYDADAAVDLAVFRPSNGGWYIAGAPVQFFGLDGDIPAPRNPAPSSSL